MGRRPPTGWGRHCPPAGVREHEGDEALLEGVDEEKGRRDERDPVAEPLEEPLHHAVLLGEQPPRLHDALVLLLPEVALRHGEEVEVGGGGDEGGGAGGQGRGGRGG